MPRSGRTRRAMLQAVGGATAAGLAGCFVVCGDVQRTRALHLTVDAGPEQAAGEWVTDVDVEHAMTAIGDDPFETAHLVAYDAGGSRLTRTELTPFSESNGYERTHDSGQCADSTTYTGRVTVRSEARPKYLNAYVPPSACESDYWSAITPVVVGSDERPQFRCGERFPFAVLDVARAPDHDHHDWPTSWFDATRSGHNPDGTGVSGSLDVAWTVAAGVDTSRPVVDAGVVLLTPAGRYEGEGDRRFEGRPLTAVDIETGAVGWTTGGNGSPHPATVAGGRVYVANRDLVALDLATGRERWAVELSPEETNVEARTPPTVAHGQAYAVDTEGRLTAVDTETGARAWTASTGEPAGPVAADADRVYAANEDGVQAYSPDGTSQWVHTAAPVRGPPRVGADGIYVRLSDAVLALDADGGQRWLQSVDTVSSTVVAGEGTVYVPGPDEIRAYAASDGGVRWRASPEGQIRLRGLVGDSLHVATDEALHVFDGFSGEQVTAVQAAGGFRRPVVAGDYVLDVTEDGTLRALEPE